MTGDILEGESPRRSALYMPGANARALDKARGLPADVLILDLEDAVSPESKLMARRLIVAAVSEGGYGLRELVVRINALDTPWGRDDLAAVAQLGANAVLVPKVESAAQVRDVAALLDAFSAPADLQVWAMIETPRALLRLEEIAGAHNRLAALVVGTSDLVKDLRARHTIDRAGLIGLLQIVVVAARSFGLTVLDGVHLALDDEVGLRLACEQGRDMGFDGKTLIHPGQIQVANDIFGPSDQEVSAAKALVDAFKAARAKGDGVTVVNGRLVEELHVQEAMRQIALSAAIARRR